MQADRAKLAVEVNVAAAVELDPGSVHEQRHDGHAGNAGKRDRAGGQPRPVDASEVAQCDRRPKPLPAGYRDQPAMVVQQLVTDPGREDDHVEEKERKEACDR